MGGTVEQMTATIFIILFVNGFNFMCWQPPGYNIFNIVHFPGSCLYTQVYSQLIAQLILLLLHVLASNCSNIQGAVIAEDVYSMLNRLSNVSRKIFIPSIVKPTVQLVGNKLVCTRLFPGAVSATKLGTTE